MGSKGAALANAISYGVNLAILALYVRVSSTFKGTWSGFSGEAFKELRQFAALAMPSAMMICTRVSNEMGARQPQAAKLATRVAYKSGREGNIELSCNFY
ncbi:hypothetical protein E2562_037264 [Oryza meyeriana var. granulata]|uniref:Protein DETOXIFICATION n=1 Tax=Oryza meyeriana var. granulata TaxID=110450 RepID=A0A6G1ECF9_9ORYZ|nr:hypothetical protein E2562_037264 [Oryza meyeriana var. granulata]